MRKVVIGVAVLVVVLVALWTATMNFVVRSYEIPSESMAPAVNPCILVNKVTYRFGSPQPGDVIVFKAPAAWPTPVVHAIH